MSKDNKNKIYQLGKMIGLKKNDINLMLNASISKQVSFSLGPPWYPGGRYGTISIKEFEA